MEVSMPRTLVRRSLAALPAVAALGALVVPGAQARPKPPKIAQYRVNFTGRGSYDVTGTDSNGDSTTVKSTFSWNANYNTLLIIRQRNQLFNSGLNERKSKAKGDWSIAVQAQESDNSCSHSGHLTLGAGDGGGIEGRVQNSGLAPLRISLGNPDYDTTGGDSGGTACSTTDFWHDWVQSFSKVGLGDDDEAVSPVTAIVRLDASDFAHGKIIEHVSSTNLALPQLTPNKNCGGDAGGSCVQHFSWTGTVTLTKKR
jgi:hypothetical protein